MTFDFLAMKTTSTVEKRAEKERQKEEEKQKALAIEQVRRWRQDQRFVTDSNVQIDMQT